LRGLIAMLSGFRDRGIRATIGAAALVACGLSSSQARAAQLGPDGIIYDTENNISWLADGDLPATNKFGLPVCNAAANPKMCVNQDGSMSYQAAAALGCGHERRQLSGAHRLATPDYAIHR
jgi:hypothetical protein